MMKLQVTLLALMSLLNPLLSGQSFAAETTCSASLACNRSISSILISPDSDANKFNFSNSLSLAESSAADKQNYKTQAIKVGTFKTYTHKQKIFSVSMPASWRKSDTSKPDEVIVTWQDSTGNAVVSIDIFDNTPDSEITNTPESLGRFMTKTINEVYKKNLKNVTVNEPDDLKNGVVRVSWAYESESNGQPIPMSGTSFIRLDRNRISIFTDIIPTEQFEPLRTALDKMVQSFTVNIDRSLPKP
jgi:hypothetical protein